MPVILPGTTVSWERVPRFPDENAHHNCSERVNSDEPGVMGRTREVQLDMQQRLNLQMDNNSIHGNHDINMQYEINAQIVNDQINIHQENTAQENMQDDMSQSNDRNNEINDNEDIGDINEVEYELMPTVGRSQRIFGESMTALEDDSMRLVSLNINNIGIQSYNNSKQDMLKNWIYENEVSIIGLQEVGVAMHLVPKYDRLQERMRDLRWKKIKISQANNTNENVEKSQYGGTAIIAYDEAAARASARNGVDNTGLGRWSWMSFEGKQNHKTRIISAYNPCKSYGDETVYMQHKRYFTSKGLDICPREQFIHDLTDQIKKWQRHNEQIVLMIDGNENFARLGPLHSALLRECRLVDPIRLAYQNAHTSLPATSSTGSVPIDSIFVSQQLRHITRGGWLKHGETVGDHRPIYIDIPIINLLGEPPFTIHRPDARRLTCEQPKVVKKFNRILTQQLENEHTLEKFEALKNDIDNNILSKEQIKDAVEKIDKSCTNSILRAEKHCRKLRMGEVPWSVELSKAGKLIQLWNLVLRKKYGRNVSSTYIKRMAKKCNVQAPMLLSIEDCITERNNASKQYRSIKKEAKNHRKQFILQLAEDQAALGNETTENAVRRIIRTEEDRGSRRRIRTATKPFHGATEKVALVDPDSDNTYITTDKEEIEDALQQENIKKFKLAYSSPFLQSPIIDDIGQTATNENAEAILNGTFSPNYRIAKATKKFIKHLKMPYSIQQMGRNSAICSVDQAALYWKKKKERTSSSFSNRHIGTYKALARETRLLQVIHGVSALAYEHGFTLHRWTYDLDVTLLKKPGKIRPDEFRTIGTLEADFNQGAALHFSHRMMNTALQTNSIPPSQYATKGRRSIEAAIVKTLFFDYLRIHKKNGSFIAMDLMQCFDRMAHPISSLSTQRLGVPSTVVETMITTLCQMKHYIRTAYGDSDDWYSGTDDEPLQGGVQGNGAAAPIFIAISCVLLSYLESVIKGLHIKTAISLTVLTITAVMYVDDADILLAQLHQAETTESLMRRTQKAANEWRKGIVQTGGALRPEKCKWYLLLFIWKNAEWKIQDGINTPQYTLQIKDTDNIPITVERLAPKIGLKGLGVHIAPDGSNADQVKALSKKIRDWNELIRTSYLNKHDVHLSAFSSIFKTIEYVLPATSLNTSECRKLDTLMHKVYVSRIGINQHLPLAYRYAPKRYQGLSSIHIESTQLIHKLKIFLSHVNQNTQLGRSIMSMLESTQLFLCVDTNFLQLDYNKYGHIIKKEKGWLAHLWQMCHKYKIQIQGEHACPFICRQNDFSLMEKVVQDGSFSKQEILHIQKCLLYLQVLHISDIADGEGARILTCYKLGQRDINRYSTYVWPNQMLPTRRMWDTWNKAINEVWTDHGRITPRLGEFIAPTHQSSTWKYCPAQQKLYDTTSIPAKVYERIELGTRSRNIFQPTQEGRTVPTQCLEKAFVTIRNPNRPKLENTCTLRTVQEHYSQQRDQNEISLIRHFFRHSYVNPQLHHIAQAIIRNNAVIVTDASIQTTTNTGAASWVLTQKDSDEGMSYGDHGVPRGNKLMDSYRGEVYGLMASLYIILMVKTKYNLEHGSVEIACDNDASLIHSIVYDTRARITNGSYDLLWAIHDVKEKIKPIKLIPIYVKGHQDQVTSELTLYERLNVYVDKRASRFRTYIEQTPDYEYSTLHKYHVHSINIDSEPITANFDSSIQNWIQSDIMKKFLNSNRSLPLTAFHEVDWDSVEKATTSLTTSRRLWLLKFTSGFCSVATKMSSCGYWDNDLCPLCQKVPENTKHILRCEHDDISKRYFERTKKVLKWMHNNETMPELIHLTEIVLRARGERTFTSCIPEEYYGTGIHQLAISQDEIGLHNFFLGRISVMWKKLQSRHYNDLDSKRSSISWANRFVLQIYSFTHSIWKRRCELIHEHDQDRMDEEEHEKLNDEIMDQYLLGENGVRECHRAMFGTPLDEILTWNVKDKKFWLLTITSSRDFISNRELNLYEGMRAVMRRWQRPIT